MLKRFANRVSFRKFIHPVISDGLDLIRWLCIRLILTVSGIPKDLIVRISTRKICVYGKEFLLSSEDIGKEGSLCLKFGANEIPRVFA